MLSQATGTDTLLVPRCGASTKHLPNYRHPEHTQLTRTHTHTHFTAQVM